MFFQCAEPVSEPVAWVCPCDFGVCAGLPDLVPDGVVDLFDFLLLLELWGPTDCAVYRKGDLDMDGNVGITDLLILLGAWGHYDPATWNRCV